MMIKTMIEKSLCMLLLLLMGSFKVVHAWAVSGPSPGSCPNSPGFGQAFLFSQLNHEGDCYLLDINSPSEAWNSWDASTGFPNDKIQSVWVGPDVTLVLFWNSFNTKDNGVPLHFRPGESIGNLGNWNRQASAARLQRFEFGVCTATPGTFMLITDPNFNRALLNDCTVLSYRNYPNPVSMGFRNDTVSSLMNTTAAVAFYKDTNFQNYAFIACEEAQLPDLNNPNRGWLQYGNFSDTISSVGVIDITCLK
jgi:hypothetical protein